MTFTVLECEQRSAEWFAARAGRLTSSNAADLFKAGKGTAESVARKDLRIRLALERLTGRTLDDDGFVSKDMQRGIEREGDARLAYEAETGQLVRQCGFIAHAAHLVGTSLDGYVGEFDGIVEFKCPKSSTHLGYLREKAIPADYLPQIRHHLWVTGAQWADFVSFDDRMPESLQLVIYRVERATLDIPGYEKAALAFLAEVEKEMAGIQALRPVVAA